jgi:hypothetical protein
MRRKFHAGHAQLGDLRPSRRVVVRRGALSESFSANQVMPFKNLFLGRVQQHFVPLVSAR